MRGVVGGGGGGRLGVAHQDRPGVLDDAVELARGGGMGVRSTNQTMSTRQRYLGPPFLPRGGSCEAYDLLGSAGSGI